MLPACLTQEAAMACMRFGLGLVRRVRESVINRFNYADGIVRRIEFDGVPADAALANRAALVEIIVVNPELSEVVAVTRAGVDSANVELPRALP